MSSETEISSVSRISRNPENVSAEVDDETVIMSITNGSYYGMNPVGSRIWALLEKETTFGTLCGALQSEFDAPPGVIEAESRAFLEKMRKENLIVIALQE